MTMRSGHSQEMETRTKGDLSSGRPPMGLMGTWSGPTFEEFVRQVESQFGLAADSRGLLLQGLARDESLAPADIRLLCSELGIPPEDFGA